MSSILPSFFKRSQMYYKKLISLNPSQMKSIAKCLLENQSISKWTLSHPKDMITLGSIMYKESNRGKMEAEKLFKIMMDTGNHDALLQYAEYLHKGNLHG